VSEQTTNRTIDDLARALAEGSISRRRALKLFAGTALAALIPSRALAQQQKVTICHKPDTPDEETIEVSQSAVEGHLRHGDQLGTCSACPDGRVELINGTCVIQASCAACRDTFGGCFCVGEADPNAPGPRTFCARSVTIAPCLNGHSDCDEGQFCFNNGAFGPQCAVAC
jgi:hypothetical protein